MRKRALKAVGSCIYFINDLPQDYKKEDNKPENNSIKKVEKGGKREDLLK